MVQEGQRVERVLYYDSFFRNVMCYLLRGPFEESAVVFFLDDLAMIVVKKNIKEE